MFQSRGGDCPPHRLIPIAGIQFTKTSEIEDPLLKVPPARRGNRAGAWLGSPREAGGTYWTGSPAPVDAMRAAADQAFTKNTPP